MTNERRPHDSHDPEGSSDELHALREALDVYVSGRSGLRFEILARFAGPLFDLYEVDWKSQDAAAAARDREELSTMLAVLETARLLWAFFQLDEEKSLQMLPELEDALLGHGAGDEERSNVLVLLSLMEGHWQQLTTDERSGSDSIPGYALPPFEQLLDEYLGRSPDAAAADRSHIGPDHTALPEMLALFAQPLLEDARVQGDPDALERQVALAQAYWELALAPPQEYEQELARIFDAFAGSARERDAIRQEASAMMQRYRRLFPERPGGEV